MKYQTIKYPENYTTESSNKRLEITGSIMPFGLSNNKWLYMKTLLYQCATLIYQDTTTLWGGVLGIMAGFRGDREGECSRNTIKLLFMLFFSIWNFFAKNIMVNFFLEYFFKVSSLVIHSRFPCDNRMSKASSLPPFTLVMLTRGFFPNFSPRQLTGADLIFRHRSR